jgi:beta-mannanase
MAAKLGRQLDINHSFYRFDDTVPSAEDKADVAAGRVPLISFNSINRNGSGVQWADIAAGKQDTKLREVARGLKALGKPVMFCFNHEPENDTPARGTTAEYRAAWKRVSDVLAEEKATNVVKVLIIMGSRTDDAFYPGDDVVDWVGGDTYNWAFSSAQPNAKWREFDVAIAQLYTWAKSHHKPILLGETGCVEDPNNAAHKAAWLTAMGEAAKKMPELKALCYFNNVHDDGDGLNGWYIDTANALAAFKKVALDPYFANH